MLPDKALLRLYKARMARFDPQTVLIRDLHALKRAARRDDARFADRLARSQAELERRQQLCPTVSFSQNLPIDAHLDELRELLSQHQVLIVAGETGSGKTTQLPKLCLDAGYGLRGRIGHTQPRRLAARAVANRIAAELGVSLGGQVGYAVRFSDQTGADTLVKVVTDGLLLTEIRRDRFLNDYEVLIIDEAHERSLNIDFLLGYLKRLLPKRPDLKVIVTSATIDVAAFSRFFDDAPIVEVSGRGYPVTVRYLDQDSLAASFENQLLEAIDLTSQAPLQGASDVLVFLTGEREIFDAAQLLRRALKDRFEVLPLYARLPAAQQNRIFTPGGRRRIILSTNVAETSLTVPNIGFVIDAGQVRISRYSFQSKLQRLPVEGISQASADQRAGRCGRLAPGVCVRMYTAEDYAARPPFTDPEIRRTNLAAVVLQMRAFGYGDPYAFPFIDAPDPRALRDAETLLKELQALDQQAQITDTGRIMARLPIDPRLARMLVEASRRGALQEVLVIASGLAVQDPRERPLDKQQQADQAHAAFRDERSDFMSLLNLWRWYQQQRESRSRAQLETACRQSFLAPARMREWRELHRQLRLATRDAGWQENQAPANYEAVHRSLVAGSLSLIATHDARGEYLAPRQLKCRIFPGSGLAQRQPRWILAAEISETQRVYARTVAQVEPAWLEQAAQHLIKRNWSEPHWDVKRGEVMAYERVTLYGLVLVERRRVSYAAIDRAASREIFLRDGLVAGAIKPSMPFLTHNQALIDEVRELEAKGRRRDLLVTDDAQLAYYADQIPQDVCTAAGLRRWYRSAARRQPDLLHMTRADIQQRQDLADVTLSFPSSLAWDDVDLALKYAFAPGAADDGISVQVPVGLLGHLRPEPMAWLVPGFLEEKCVALVRALPKSQRRQLAPVPDKIAALMPVLLSAERYRQGRLELTLSTLLAQRYDAQISPAAWQEEALPAHLRMNYQVRDADGRLLAESRELGKLQAQYQARLEAGTRDAAAQAKTQAGLQAFPADGVPSQLLLETGDGPVMAFPALRDRGDTVDLELATSVNEANIWTAVGMARLVLLQDAARTRQFRDAIRRDKRLQLHFAPLGDLDTLAEQLLVASVWRTFFPEVLARAQDWPRTPAAFDALLTKRRSCWGQTFTDLLSTAGRILNARLEVVQVLDAATSPAYVDAVADARSQLDDLVGPDFLLQVPPDWLPEIERYLAGIRYRIEHLQGRVGKDAENMKQLHAWEQRLSRLGESVPANSLAPLRFALQEYRITLFAQPVGAREKVSARRLETLFRPWEIEAGLR